MNWTLFITIKRDENKLMSQVSAQLAQQSVIYVGYTSLIMF